MKLYPLSRTVLAIHNNAALFLNGLTSNAPDKPRNAFVNIRGRIMATFDQHRVSDDEFVIAVERAFVDPLLTHLDKYIRLSGVRVEKLDRYVYFDVEETSAPSAAGTLAIPQKKGRLLISKTLMPAQVSDEEFRLFRLQNNIPLQGVDYRDEFLLNVSDEEFVSYVKGCFLGQEPIAKVHNRSKPAWKLVVRYRDECTEEERHKMTSVVVDPATRRPRGFVFVHT
jgi:folate-binding protein YgfZ